MTKRILQMDKEGIKESEHDTEEGVSLCILSCHDVFSPNVNFIINSHK